MPRPKPTIIEQFPKGHWTEQIIETEQSVYAVGYKGRIISMRSVHNLLDRILYPNHLSTHRGHIERAVRVLNQKSNSLNYSVIQLKLGE